MYLFLFATLAISALMAVIKNLVQIPHKMPSSTNVPRTIAAQVFSLWTDKKMRTTQNVVVIVLEEQKQPFITREKQ